MSDLLNCLWCKSSNVYLTSNGAENHFCCCNECGAEGPTAETPELAAKKWNTRNDSMTPASAKEVLEGMGLDHFSEDHLYREHPITGAYVRVKAGDSMAGIDGHFTAEQFQAIALWMQDPEGVTNAQTNTVEVVRDE